ncbi:hypothetical protein INT47_011581 [Mucor saturninus]|uniref:Reverse transcriptase domain-containing protein n=1 Tax=Mucor saturninus TaxID=64648 RepID=A0A8H7QHP3_9FUNG|nr:hypothetical protein INT47_011581 [Mucor saturninus]
MAQQEDHPMVIDNDTIMKECEETVPLEGVINASNGEHHDVTKSTSAVKEVNIYNTHGKLEKVKEVSMEERVKNYKKIQEEYRSRMMNLMDVIKSRKGSRYLNQALASVGKAKGSKDSKWASNNQAIRASDIPRLQLSHWTKVHFPSKETFSSAEHFVHEFETTLSILSRKVEDEWRTYILAAIPFDFITWGKQTILTCASWTEAKEIICRKFGDFQSKDTNSLKLFDLYMKPSQSISQFANQFTNFAAAAGINKDNKIVVLLFRARLFDPCKPLIFAAMEAKKQVDENYVFTVDKICDIGREIFGDEPVGESARLVTNKMNTPVKRRRGSASHEWQQYGVKKNQGCPKHGGEKANHTAEECRSQDLKKSKFLGNKNSPFKATGNNMKGQPCRYCKKEWQHGHTCKEYYEQKNNRTVLALRREDDEDDQGPKTLNIKEAMEVDAYEWAIEANKNIPKGSFCTMPEALIHIPLKEKTDNMYIKQYPLVYHQIPEIQRQINEWVNEGIVYESVPSSKFNTPLLAVGKKDDQTWHLTKLRVCMDLRRVNANIDDSKTDKYVIPDMEQVFAEVSAPGRIYTKIDLKNAYFLFPVDSNSQEILSFSFRNKTYRWKGCCFGLSFISQQYSRVIAVVIELIYRYNSIINSFFPL